MFDDKEPAAWVRAWLEERSRGLPPGERIGLFERAWNALWRRTEWSLGDVTAAAAAARVVAGAAAKYPSLSGLRLEACAIVGGRLQERLPDPDRLREALGCLLSESIELIAHLSGNILTPILRSELARTCGEEAAPPVKPAGRNTMSEGISTAKLGTGVMNLDSVLDGGLSRGSINVVAGPPGSGKTTLAEQICFHVAAPDRPALYLSTFSEPAAKRMRYMRQFDFFAAEKLGSSVELADIGGLLRDSSVDRLQAAILEPVSKSKPALLVVDSFRVFNDVVRSPRELRRFVFDLSASLLTWDCTTLLIGEYVLEDIASNPLFSIVDGLIMLSQSETAGEERRFLQVLKMRGAAHSPDRHSFEITRRGVEVYAPRVTIRRRERAPEKPEGRRFGVSKLDELLGGNILGGSSLLISGASGTGKTVLLLETLYRSALAGEKGILFSFEETPGRLRGTARGLGWDFDAQIDRGMIEIVFVPHPDIRVEHHLLMMHERIAASRPARVAIDSLSVFLHKVADPRIVREKTFQLATIVEESGAVGLFAADVPYGSNLISRMGVEETVVDGAVILSSVQEGLERRRYIEVYKLRGAPHLLGRHAMAIESGGLCIYPRYNAEARFLTAPPALKAGTRVRTGVPGLDELLGGGLLDRSATIVSGSSGIGKSTLSLQFIAEGGRAGEKGIYVTLEEGPEQILSAADALAIPVRELAKNGLVDIVYFSPEHVRAAQFLTVLTDRIQERGARRLVVDSTSNMVTAGIGDEEVRQLLYNLVVRFKILGVTALLTLESDALHSTDLITERGISPVADNLIMLRYAEGDGNAPQLTVVKTRGSVHAPETHAFAIAQGGVRMGPAQHPARASQGVRA
ncbi:MAG TPA: ATPase domain-containing protein [Elusimicrobiota bacterium]|jgi:circadian clock protein KaiC|nr:ATPase domain-containing protein [Elusimicrobiota bacterium]